MFNNSAAGTDVTSCQFAEAVRGRYLQQPTRGTTVTLAVFSPVTSQAYMMTCTGNHVVACTGGNSAVVYIY
jgi:serine/threonine-protein kinase